MFVLNLKISKKRLLALLTGILTAVIAIIIALSLLPESPNGESSEDRKAYIYSLGYRATDESKSEIVIPQKFGELYERYNEKQLEAGFDLKNFAGEKATLYSYRLDDFSRDDVYLNLIVFEGKIIGGDVSTLYSDGFMLPLVSKNKNAKVIEGKY